MAEPSSMAGFVGGALSGLMAGLIPFFVAQHRSRPGLAWSALLVGIALGAIGGALLAVPGCVVFTLLALRYAEQLPAPQVPLNYWKIAIPASGLLWLAGLGAVALTLPPSLISARITVPIGFIAMVIGGWIASLVLRFANRTIDARTSDELSSKIASIGAPGSNADQQTDKD